MNFVDEVLFQTQETSLSDMTDQDGFHLSLDEIDLSLLRLSSSPDSLREFPRNSPGSSTAAAAGYNSPMKRPSPGSDISDQPKRRKVFVQKQDLINPSVLSDYPENKTFSYPNRSGDPILKAPILLRRSLFDGYACSVSEKQEPTPFKCKTFSENTTLEESPESKVLKKINDRVKEMNQWCKDLDRTNEETQEQTIEKDSEEGMRIERSGDGYVIRLKCPCQQAYRILFSHSHFYFKLL